LGDNKMCRADPKAVADVNRFLKQAFRGGVLAENSPRKASGYHKSDQSIVPTTIAIRMDPQMMDVRRDAASSLSKSLPDSKTKRRLSGWLSKTRTRRMVLPLTSAAIGRETMAKILFCPETAKSRRTAQLRGVARIH
jgi:hypothetical protein